MTAAHLGKGQAAFVGLASTIAGAGAGHLVAAITGPSYSPPFAVGSAVVDAAPTWLKNFAVSTFGTADKPVLLASVALVSGLLGALAGLLARTRLVRGVALLGVLVALAGLAAWARPGGGVFAVIPSLATAFVGVGSFVAVMSSASGSSSIAPGVASGDVTRRTMLSAGALAGLGAVAAGMGQKIGSQVTQMVRALPRPSHSLPAMPAGLERTVRGVTPLVTPNSNFYRIDTALVVPNVDAGGWRLVIDGDVEEELEFTYDDILAMPLVEADVTLTCVSNEVGGEYAGGARWLGVPVRDLLAKARPRSGADQVLSVSNDGWTCSTPIEAFQDKNRQALLAVGMNGEPLPREHGFPARLVTPGLYGYVGATKWVTKLTVTTYAEHRAYWTDRGWSEKGPIKPSTRIDTPRAGRTIDAGRVAIGGVAWAQHQGIVGVEVQIDDGEWQTAKLGPNVGIDYWRQWWLSWDAPKGQHTIKARCRYADGKVQTSQEAEVTPDGASGWHTVSVGVR